MDNTEKKRIKILNYRTSQGIAPKPENIVHGEIAIGYKKDNEAIYIKNTANDIVDFTPISIINITYDKLKKLRDNSNLKPSQYYRITDFVTTVANDLKAQSAGHPFDLIILATDKNKLQEECYAIQHENDTYFANCNLAAWKIWYCLDNDTTKYAWANTTDGKGVIYHMIDEWQNDCPYDFKNIMFSRTVIAGGLNIDGAYYTFSWVNKANEVEDASIVGQTLTNDGGSVNGVHDNLISVSDAYNLGISNNTTAFALNGNVFVSEYTFENGIFYGIYGNHFAINCYNNTFGNDCYNNTFGNDCYNNTFGNKCDGNTFGNDCYGNTFGNGCYGNTFGNGCFNNTFGNFYYNNTLGDNCNYNSFGNDCYSNTFGDGCYGNTFGGNDCYNNTFGNDCYNNTFGNKCDGNTFGNDCDDNTFGDNCDRNTFGNNCDRNTFGNGCISNTFGNRCCGNSFGDNCDSNTFGNYCYNNTSGNYFQYNALGNDIQYIKIPTEKIYNTQILNGTQGTQSNILTLAFTPETTYSQFAGFTSDGVLKIWVEADAPHDTVDGGSY